MVEAAPSRVLADTLNLDILEHVHRFRMTTQHAVQRLLMDSYDLEGVKTRLRRLQERGFLAQQQLWANSKCYHLTPKAAKQVFGESSRAGQPLRGRPLKEAFATLTFCTFHDPPLHKFTRKDFTKAYPDLVATGLPAQAYYREADEHKRIGFIIVDCGADSRNLVRKCKKVVRTRFKHTPWRQQILDDRFLVTIITALPTKQRRLQELLAEETELREVTFRVVLCPDLANLLD